LKIREIEIKNPVIMAPMAGITNMAFRKIVKEFGAGLVYSEMVSDKAIKRQLRCYKWMKENILLVSSYLVEK